MKERIAKALVCLVLIPVLLIMLVLVAVLVAVLVVSLPVIAFVSPSSISFEKK